MDRIAQDIPVSLANRSAEPRPLTSPLVCGHWRALDKARRATLLQQVRAALAERAVPDARLFAPTVHAQVLSLPFYTEAGLVHVELEPEPGRRSAWTLFVAEDLVQVVDGRSHWLHAWNAGGRGNRPSPLATLDAPLAAAYLKFFCGVVWGEQGPFRVVECVDDALLAMPTESARRLGDHVAPVVAAPTGDGAFDARAAIWYGGTLFAAEFRIYQTGMVEMREDEPLAVNVGTCWTMAPPLHQCLNLGSLS
ncbi:MAG TPA: hypothetical protein VLJ86_00780 [Ramlibacter sp.]|nr:hypothetical protein [Ramlibacter sp.]